MAEHTKLTQASLDQDDYAAASIETQLGPASDKQVSSSHHKQERTTKLPDPPVFKGDDDPSWED